MSSKERKRQESMFELISSESSYLRSLNVLINYFMASEELRASVTNTEFHHLFSNVEAVRRTSRQFYHSLTKRRKASSVSMHDVCDIILEHVTAGDFEPYVTYCSNESYQQRALQRLMDNNPAFLKILRQLEGGEECAGLPLHSFLLLPMQRITRLPLLVDTIFQRCDVSMPQYDVASRALRETTNLVKKCNERAKSLERTEQMIQLQHQLDFKSTRSFALISPSRFLVKQGVLTRTQDESVLGFRRVARQDVCLFLFNDVLLIAKKKSDDAYTVTDYFTKERLRSRDVINDPVGFILVVEQNQENQRTEMRFEADKPSTKSRWMAVLRHQPVPYNKISNSNLQVSGRDKCSYFSVQKILGC
uniref:Rho guanine nucleotide exchange factor 26-like n=1 Tax=Phallusia mammillata TaxID=59560 RepID=A0A6F9D7C5_9ASCI|nr:rho guanine nucleotide exchange factor 26-like [Phallusia mammillata]